MKNIIQYSKKGVLKLDQVKEVFSKSSDLEEMKKAVAQCEERVYLSWASVDVIDKAGENIPIDDLIKQQDILLAKGGIITDEHTNAIVGNTIAYKVMNHPTGKIGVLHLNKIHSLNILDDQVWKETVSGERTGSSVGGFTDQQSAYTSKDGEISKELRGFNQFETASVHSPCNPLALNEAVSLVAKSESKRGEMLVINERSEVVKITYDNLGKIAKNNAWPPQHIKEQNSTIKQDLKESEKNMENDVLKIAIEKMQKGESLNDAEKSAVLANVANKEAPKEDEKEEPKTEKKKADGQPESPTVLEDANGEVIKQLSAQIKAMQESMAAMSKSFEAANKTAPVMVQKEAVQKVNTPSPFAPSSAPVSTIPSAVDIALGKKVQIGNVNKNLTWKEANKMYEQVRKSSML